MKCILCCVDENKLCLIVLLVALCEYMLLPLPLHVQHTGHYITCSLECILSHEFILTVVKICKSECGAGAHAEGEGGSVLGS